MLVEVRVPQLAESVAEATVATWHRKAGDWVTRGQTLCDLETDKVTLEVAAPEDGVIQQLVVETGAVVLREAVLAVLDTEGTASATAAPVETPAPPVAAAAATVTATAAVDPPRLSPAVRKLVAEHQINPADVPSNTLPGRVTKSDVLSFLATAEDGASTRAALADEPAPGGPAVRSAERVPMTRLRKRTAERLLAAQRESALLTTFNEFNLHRVNTLREEYREPFEKRYGIRLGLMSFFVRGVVEALKRFPIINAAVEGDDIIYHGYFDIGIAVSSPRGLVVPILRDADRLSLAEVESSIRTFGERARDGKLTVEDLTGGTFTITNGGTFGSMLSTPIVNPPQSAILGMHKIEQRPIAEKGQVVIRPMMYTALSYDHRIIDGRDAVGFLVAVKEYLEEPERLLIGL
jgi:2-oxoglutarate dehydrogenase E2 component (dihydrolipoamide succinyltransferase)